jgi:hypothetical protein
VTQRIKYMRSGNTTLLFALNYHVPPCTANKTIVSGNWLGFSFDIIIIIIILVITFMQGI